MGWSENPATQYDQDVVVDHFPDHTISHWVWVQQIYPNLIVLLMYPLHPNVCLLNLQFCQLIRHMSDPKNRFELF